MKERSELIWKDIDANELGDIQYWEYQFGEEENEDSEVILKLRLNWISMIFLVATRS